MTDRPIPFSAPMVRALLDGRKTQTRRVLKPQPIGPVAVCLLISFNHGAAEFSLGPQDRKPNGDLIWRRLPISSDRLWVREAYYQRVVMHKGRLAPEGSTATAYAWLIWETGSDAQTELHWIPPSRKRLERPSDYPKEAL